jgi:serine/threonine protein kinase/Flp pilus assembly protein TadD
MSSEDDLQASQVSVTWEELWVLAEHKREKNSFSEAKKYYSLLLKMQEVPAEKIAEIKQRMQCLAQAIACLPQETSENTEIIGRAAVMDTVVVNTGNVAGEMTLANYDLQQELETDHAPATGDVELQTTKKMTTQPLPEIPGYEIVQEIGKGAMGQVYKAVQKSLHRFVAIKVVPPAFSSNDLYSKRLENEALAMAQLRHPNIVAAIDSGFHNRHYYIVMEYIEGGRTLKHLIEESGRLSEKKVAQLGVALANALGYLKQNGLVHRDIKPSNILIDKDGTPKLADMGLVKGGQQNTELTESGTVVGTVGYMSPEQLSDQKDLDIRADIYSLGATLLYAATGKPRFDNSISVANIYCKVLTEDPQNLQEFGLLSGGMERILCRMLRKNSQQRYQTPEELQEAWLSFLDELERQQTRSAAKAHSKLRPVLAVGVVALLAAAWASWHWGWPAAMPQEKPPAPVAKPPSEKPVTPPEQPVKITLVVTSETTENTLLQEIRLLCRERQYAQAVAKTIALLQKNSLCQEAWQLCGQCYLEMGQWNDAAQNFSKAVALQASYAPHWQVLGCCQCLQGDYEAALASLERSLSLEKSAAAFYWLARVHFARQVPDKASQYIASSLMLEPDFWPARYLATVLAESDCSKAWEAGKDLADKAQADAGSGVVAWLSYYQAVLLYRLGEYEQARKIFTRHFTGQPSKEVAAYLGLLSWQDQKWREAVQYWQEAGTLPGFDSRHIWQIDVSPIARHHITAATIYHFRGLAYTQLKEYQAAIEDLTKALALEPRSPKIVSARLAVYEEINDTAGIANDTSAFLAMLPQQHAYRLKRAHALIRLHKWAEAEQDLAYLLAQGYQKQDVLSLALQTHLDTGNKEAALADVNLLLAIETDNAAWLFTRASLLEQSNNVEAAARDYQKVLTLDAGNKKASERLVHIYSQKRDYPLLIEVYGTMLKREPQNAELFYQRALSLIEAQRWAEAISDLTFVMQKEESNAHAYFHRGVCHYRQGEMQTALVDLSHCLTLHAEYAKAYYWRAEILRHKGEWAPATTDYTKYLVSYPADSDALSGRAQCLMKRNHYSQALKDWETLLASGAKLELWESKGECQLKLALYREALQSFDQAARLGQLSAPGWNHRGFCHYKLNQLDDAIADYRRAIGREKNFALAHMNLGVSLYFRQQYNDAIAAISQVVTLEPNHADAYDYRSQIYLKLKKYDLAVSDLTQLLRLKPQSGEAYFHRGYSFYNLNQMAKAQSDLTLAVQYDRDGKFASQAKKILKKIRSGKK